MDQDLMAEWVNHIPGMLRRLNRLERLMTAVDDVITQLNNATNDIAADLEELRNQVASFDAATADKFTPLVQRLQQLAADPNNPVPEPV